MVCYRNPSLNRTDVAESAVVLHWQGTDSSLKPILVSNSDGVSGVYVHPWTCIIDSITAVLAPQSHAQGSSCGDDDTEHKWELADVQSGVGML